MNVLFLIILIFTSKSLIKEIMAMCNSKPWVQSDDNQIEWIHHVQPIDSPAVGAGTGTTLAGRCKPKGCPPAVEAETGRFRLRLNFLKSGWALSSSCSGSVRGLKCLHRHDFIFNSIWLRSVEEGDEREELKVEELLSEVFVSEVLANLSVAGEHEVVVGGGGGGGGEVGRGRSSISGSSPWKMLSKSV